MAVNSTHPTYAEFINDWKLMRDTFRGERVVKEKGTVYLPATQGMDEDGMAVNQPGWKAYQKYLQRAVFPDIVNDAVEAMLGVMHSKPPTIELPDRLEPMRENATVNNESLNVLLRRINEEQLVSGRLGLLADVMDGAGPDAKPYISIYTPEAILNWDDGERDDPLKQTLNLVVVNESEFVRMNSDFEWEHEEKYRIMVLGDPFTNDAEGVYSVGVFDDSTTTFSLDGDNVVQPSIGGNTLDEIPFVFINSKDVVADPDDPPLLGLARLALAIYRGEADYRQSLFMQGQDTLVVVGGDEKKKYRIGASATLHIPVGADAKYIGVTSDGLAEQREALENDGSKAAQKGGQLLDTVSREAESGEALKIRVAARTATLNQIALTGAFALQQLLQILARWVGANPEEVVVTPNLDFAADEMSGRTLLEYQSAKNMGAPISQESIHRLMQQKDVTAFTFEEEMELIDEEVPIVGGTEEGGDEEDDNQGNQGDDT